MLLKKLNLCLCERAQHKHRLKIIKKINEIIRRAGTTFKFDHWLTAEWMARVLLRLLCIDTPDWQEAVRSLLPLFAGCAIRGCAQVLRD
jgi:hypothetical protein